MMAGLMIDVSWPREARYGNSRRWAFEGLRHTPAIQLLFSKEKKTGWVTAGRQRRTVSAVCPLRHRENKRWRINTFFIAHSHNRINGLKSI